MSSQQLRRENKTNEREIRIEKDRVPKMASHFESITVEDAGDGAHVTSHVIETMGGSADVMHGQSASQKDKSLGTTMQSRELGRGREAQKTQGITLQSTLGQQQTSVTASGRDVLKGTNVQNKEEIGKQRGTTTRSMQKKEGGEKHDLKGSSLEDISKYRGTAQQNSYDAIRAAEERYQKAKEMEASKTHNVTKSQGTQTERGSGVTQMAAEGALRAADYTTVKGQQAKESLSSASQIAMEKAGQAKNVVVEKTSGVTETAVDVSKKSASYVGEKAVAAKDVAVETGKTTAGYVGKVAGVVKDKAVVAGWSAAELASGTALGVTETMANVTAGVAGFAGNTAVATKDAVVKVGTKTKEMVVSTEESVKEYAARKKAEKERELEAKNAKGEEGEIGGQRDVAWEFKNEGGGGGGEGYEESYEQQWSGGDIMVEGDFEHEGVAAGGGGGASAAAGGVMRVIGETLVEIGQKTPEMFGRGGQREEGGENKDVGRW